MVNGNEVAYLSRSLGKYGTESSSRIPRSSRAGGAALLEALCSLDRRSGYGDDGVESIGSWRTTGDAFPGNGFLCTGGEVAGGGVVWAPRGSGMWKSIDKSS